MPGLEQSLATWLPRQRWFGAIGHAVEAVQVRSRVVLAQADDQRVEHLLVSVDLADAPTQLFQVPLIYRATPLSDSAAAALHGAVGQDEQGWVAYDGLRDPDAIAVLAEHLAAGRPVDHLRFAVEDGVTIPAGLTGRALSAEQSNTSVVLGELLLVKVFRRVAPGLNPDLELHRALAAAGCTCIAPVRAWLEGEVDGEPTTLAMAHDYALNVADGWQMALTSVRDLFLEADLHAEEVGTDFSGEAHRIGTAVAEAHAGLAAALGTVECASTEGPTSPVPGMLARLDAAVQVVPELAEHVEAMREVFQAAEPFTASLTMQRVHGDLHLGQVLRVPARWLLIDFEGEPAKSLADRRRPDSVLRDIAGMLRSFDYAAFHQLTGSEHAGPPSQLEFRAREWAQLNISSFCEGYAEVTGADPREHPELLRAYELDKAIYEAVYEAQHRPTWLAIPLRAIRRLSAAPPGATPTGATPTGAAPTRAVPARTTEKDLT
ncbi:hypothetical protein [Rhodococcus sp. X156]|uniref:maltokinase N-terminal cap-like domain-containing protein n=1 Tax=Rhodococcus sp. X156 TaxID=2499145 RepID=UPI0013E35EA4|nr:hypothetical protein [Rhodococcus sp. X156]